MAAIDSLVDDLERSYNETKERLSDPAVYNDHREAADIGRRLKELEVPHKLATEWREVRADLTAAEADGELRELVPEYEARLEHLEEELKLALVETDPADEKNVIVEIRAGTGGDEAALFAADLFRMYTRYAERQRWKVEVVSEPRRTGAASARSSSRSRAGAPTATCATRAGFIASSACPPRRARAGSTPPPRAWRSCQKRKRSISRSTITTCASTCTARLATAARASTRPTRQSGSRTYRPAWSSPARTRKASSRTS